MNQGSGIDTERLDRIEQHLKLLRKDSDVYLLDIKEIKDALLGTALNNYQGLVWRVSDMNQRLEKVEERDQEIKVYLNQFKVVIGAILAGLVTLLIKVFGKQ